MADPRPFLKAALTDVCEQCMAVLKPNMYGTLGKDWTYKIEVNADTGEATVYHTRLEGDRERWEKIFTYHNQGTVAHGPKTAKVMHWIDKDTGEDVWAHWVKGISALHFAEKCERVISDFENRLESKWARWCETGRYG
jgi:hypothetical protein